MRKGILVACVMLWGVVASAGRAGSAGIDTPGQQDADSGAAQAKAAVSSAQVAVRAAADQRALWTTAQTALAQAQAELEQGHYGEARRLAEFAADQARLGIAQMRYQQFQ